MAAQRQDLGAEEQDSYSLAHFQGQSLPELLVNCLRLLDQMYECEVTLLVLNSIRTRNEPRPVLKRKPRR